MDFPDSLDSMPLNSFAAMLKLLPGNPAGEGKSLLPRRNNCLLLRSLTDPALPARTGTDFQ